jgi:hypothetical protein
MGGSIAPVLDFPVDQCPANHKRSSASVKEIFLGPCPATVDRHGPVFSVPIPRADTTLNSLISGIMRTIGFN